MEWNVLHYNLNTNQIEKFNIFNHWKFVEYLQKHIKECTDKDDFASKIKSELFYYFGNKAEWELVLKRVDNQLYLYPWCGCINPEEVKLSVSDNNEFSWSDFANERIIRNNEEKIDVYDQVVFHFYSFITYCLKNQYDILKLKR